MKKKYENYSGVYKEMIEILGEEATLKIYENFRGQQVTFPMRLHSKEYVEQYIMKNYNGKNIREISRKVGYTCNWVQQVINKLNIKENGGREECIVDNVEKS